MTVEREVHAAGWLHVSNGVASLKHPVAIAVLRVGERLHVSNGVASLKPSEFPLHERCRPLAPRQQWRGLIETRNEFVVTSCSSRAPRQQWRGLIETPSPRARTTCFSWLHVSNGVASLKLLFVWPSIHAYGPAPRQQWRGLIETSGATPGHSPL